MKQLFLFVSVVFVLNVKAQKDTIEPITYSEAEIFMIVQEQPQFPGGQDGLMKYMGENVSYPKEALADSAQGVVYVQFVVNTDGCVDSTHSKVLR